MHPIYQTCSQLKEKARRQLEGKYGTAVGMQMLVNLISFSAGLLISAFFPATSIFTYVIQLIITFLVSAIVSVSSIGITLYHLNIACGGPYGFGNLWFGFQNQFSKSLILSLVITGITFLYQVIIEIPMNLYASTYDMTYIFITIPVMLIAVVVYFYFSLLFSTVFYLLLDYPTYSAGEILKLAPKVIKGHKRRLLYMELSFLPLTLLSILTCGIGILWVNTYRNMTMTNFYLDLMNPGKPEFNQTV